MIRLLPLLLLASFTLSLQAVELPPNLTPLHHWDAYNPLGNNIQPSDNTVITNLVDLAGGNNAGLVGGGPLYLQGDATTIGGQPTIRFTAPDGLRSINAITDQTVTIFSVSKLNGGLNRRLITGTYPSNYLLGYWGGREDRAHNGAFFGTAAAATTNQHMYIHQALNDGSDTLQDGDRVIPNGNDIGASVPVGQLGFGGINWSGGETSNGDISEIIIFDSNMDPNDFNDVGQYLAQKYGFVAFGHDGTVLGGGPSGPSAFTWTNGSGDNQWSNGQNWFGGTPPGPGDVALFDRSVAGGTVDLGGGTTVGGINFFSGADGFVLTNGPLDAGLISNGSLGTNTIQAALTADQIYQRQGNLELTGNLNLSRATEINVVTGVLPVSGSIMGGEVLDKTGAGTLHLLGANTFTGLLEVHKGALRIANNQALGATNGVTVVGLDATLELGSGFVYNGSETIQLAGTLTAVDSGTIGAGVPLMLANGARFTSSSDGQYLGVETDLDINCLGISGDGEVELSGVISSSNQDIQLGNLDELATGTYSITAGGSNQTMYVENDGISSWLLVGRGREGWEFDEDGQGAATNVIQDLATTNAFAPVAYPSALITDIINQAGLDRSGIEIRIKRAFDPEGLSYHESRWRHTTQGDWSWAFDSSLAVQHRVLGPGGSFFRLNSNTRDTPAANNDAQRIFTWPWVNHGNMQGFSFGSTVTNGANDGVTFLWENADENHAIPYTEIYIRGLKTEGLFKNGSGTLSLTANNSYDLDTVINEGVVEVWHENGLGSTNGVTIVQPNGKVSFGNGLARTSVENVQLIYEPPGGTIGNMGQNEGGFSGTISVTGQPHAVVNEFYGGDAGEGLDLDGDFLYAVNARGAGGLQVRDALFLDEASEPNVIIGARNEILAWNARPEYGSSADDENLETIMHSIRWEQIPQTLSIELNDLTPGEGYKIQMLMHDPSIFNRGFDVHLDLLVDGRLILDEFSPSRGGVGVVVTLVMRATESSHTILFNGENANYNDHAPILHALTVEQNVPVEGFPGVARIEADQGLFTLDGPIQLGNSTLEVHTDRDAAVLIPVDLSGGTDGGILKQGEGLVALSGDNQSLAGDILIEEGQLYISSDTALGDGGETRTAGGTLVLEGGVVIENEQLRLDGTGDIDDLENRGSTNNTIAASSSIYGLQEDINIASYSSSLIIDAPIDLGYGALSIDGSGDTIINGIIGSSASTNPIPFEDTVLSMNPSAYYTFDNLVDGDTVANDGSLTNTAEILGVAAIAPGLHGNGLAIGPDDGNGILEVNLPGTTTPNPIDLPSNGNYTLGGWFNGLHVTGFRTFSRSNAGGEHQALVENGSFRLGMWQGGFVPSGYNVDGTGTPALDVQSGWHFLVVVGHSTNRTDYYIDNQYAGSIPRTSRTDVWRIGAWPGQTFSDLIDDFFVYDRRLSREEIDLLWRSRDSLIPNNQLRKLGTGHLTLTGDNSYTSGTTISGGTLLVDNTTGSGTGTGDVWVLSGTILGGDGSIAGTVQVNGGIIAPGQSPGSLDAGAVNFASPSGNYVAELFGAGTNPLQYDQLNSSGDVMLDGNLLLARDPGYTLSGNDQLVIVSAQGTLTGTFSGLAEGATVTDNAGGSYTISYQGNAVTLIPQAPVSFDVADIGFAYGPGPDEGSVTLSWPSSQGSTFRIESAPHPEGPWTAVATGIAGSEGTTMHTVIIANLPNVDRLYLRVGED